MNTGKNNYYFLYKNIFNIWSFQNLKAWEGLDNDTFESLSLNL